MHVNWWSVSGLCLDIIGVLGVALIPRWAVNTGKGTMSIGGVTPELEGLAFALDWLSWGICHARVRAPACRTVLAVKSNAAV